MSHPPHLKSNLSSAFIPFCAYKTNLNISGKSLALDGTNFPLCSTFLPTILEGQLCYMLELNKLSGQGQRNELMLLLDYNEDLSLQASFKKNRGEGFSNDTINFDRAIESVQGSEAKVQINTLSPYVGFGGGIYTMTVVKKMLAKEDFLNMPMEDRDCEIELYEDCRTRKLFEQCKCKPWEVDRFEVRP